MPKKKLFIAVVLLATLLSINRFTARPIGDPAGTDRGGTAANIKNLLTQYVSRPYTTHIVYDGYGSITRCISDSSIDTEKVMYYTHNTDDNTAALTDQNDNTLTPVRPYVENRNGSVQYVKIGDSSRIYVTSGNGKIYELKEGEDYKINNGTAVFLNTTNAKTVQTAVNDNRNYAPGTYAMLSYVVQKNGGTIYWNDNYTILTVSMNGYTNVYTASDLNIINGRVIMPSSRISSDFGLYGTTTFSTIYDRFRTMDEAAMAFSLTYRQMSFEDNREYLAYIYEDNTGGNDAYFFGYINKGTDRSGGAWPANDTKYVRASWIHTHAAWLGSGTGIGTNQQVFTGKTSTGAGDAIAAISAYNNFSKYNEYYKKDYMRYAYLINNQGVLKRLDAYTVDPNSHYIWDIENKGPGNIYSDSVDIVARGLMTKLC